jgi:diguanylate cyclase (GGDEF)-like protein
VCRSLGHTPGIARWAHAPPFAGKRHKVVIATIVTAGAGKNILGHFNQALDEVTDFAERAMLVRLNLKAGKRAMKATASTTALASFQAALSLLPAESWDTDYELTLELHTGAVTAAFLCGNYLLMDSYGHEVLGRARTIVDKVPVFKAKAEVCVSENRNLDAILTVLPVLSALGIRFPVQPTADDISAALGKTMARLAQRPVEALLELPLMTDPQKLAAMEILVSMSASCYQSFPALFPLVVLEQVDLSLEYGNCEMSAFGYMTYAMILTGLLEDFESAYRYGQTAINIARKFESKKIYGKILFLFNNNVRHHKVHLRDTLPNLSESAAITMDLGDPEYSCLTRLGYLQHMFFLGEHLGKVQSEMAFSADVMRGVKQEIALKFTNIYRQAVLNLTEGRGIPWVLAGDAFDEAVPISANETTTFYCLYSCRGMLEYWFGQYEDAEKSMNAAMGTLAGAIGLAGVAIIYFYDCLSKLAILPLRSEESQKQLWAEIDSSLAKLKFRAKLCPANHQHKVLFVEAERQRALGGIFWETLNIYEQAIRLAGQNGYLHEEAMANERAGTFALALGSETIGRAYLVQAHRAYLQWGATIKVRALEQTHSFLEQPEYLPESSDLYRDKLDIISALKASEVISGEIHLDGLLKKIMDIVIENAGAEKGFLLLSDDGNWVVAAQANVRDGITHLENSPLTGFSLVCEAIVRFVIRTRQDLFLEDAGRNSPFQTDPQVVDRGIRSVLCLPLASQNRLSGIIYLENNLTVGAFSAKRSQVLKMLTAQASIAIENALLYQSLELKVAERTKSLEEANSKLKAMSDTDGLTGVVNRRRFDEVLEAEWRRAARSGLSLGLIMLDVDWFKKYNDSYGHQAGDACLQRVAEVLLSRARRAGDLAARYGGEEFAFIAPETDRKSLQTLAEEIRHALETLDLPHDGSAFGKITASLGIAVRVPAEEQSPTQLILEADQALYRAKAEGRNRVAG